MNYYVSENNMLFNKAYTFGSKGFWGKGICEAFMKKVINVDISTSCSLHKPISGRLLCSLINMQAVIINLVNILLGQGIQEIS